MPLNKTIFNLTVMFVLQLQVGCWSSTIISKQNNKWSLVHKYAYTVYIRMNKSLTELEDGNIMMLPIKTMLNKVGCNVFMWQFTYWAFWQTFRREYMRFHFGYQVNTSQDNSFYSLSKPKYRKYILELGILTTQVSCTESAVFGS